MILLCQWYEPSDEDRAEELRSARRWNEECGLFDRTVYLSGESRRWSYRDFFDFAASHYRDEVVVVANTDCEFTETCRRLPDYCEPRRLVTLTRWEHEHQPNMLGHFVEDMFFSGTQDAWAFVADRMPHMDRHVILGKVGCDNVIAGWAATSGCEVINPSLSLRVLHSHKEKQRHHAEPEYGTYGYPHLNGETCSGLVMCHEWPVEPGKEYKASLVSTCNR